ncbi:MAG TPA: ABC-F family ATP-binding cassette domain-containing protein [Chitinispirillaceae bacterium]|nr:ABC-F family ATP-binding cassette domain-containing protein [Chitinispirillaceae bacterium]
MITLENISKQYGSTVLLESVTASFNEIHRTGLIGVNGSGKTTLLRMLGGEEFPDSGSISKPSDLRIGYLPQEVEILDNKTPLEIVLQSFAHILNFEEQLQNLTAESLTLKDTLKKIDSLCNEMEFHDGYSLTARAQIILGGLGIPKGNWSKPIQLLSGGYRMRTVLGKLLLEAPDFLLLDEPTNHLDMDSLVWLEKFLEKQKCGMLIVSHDRDFLNRITTNIADISNHKITMYQGNYDAYIRIREETEIAQQNRARNLEAKISQTERFVERFKAKATKATQAQSRMKLLEKLRSDMPEVHQSEKTIHFSFPEPKQSGNIPLQFTGVSAGYGAAPVFSNLTLSVNRGEKIAIVGPNGSGKSTLLKLASGLIQPINGSVNYGTNVSIRYFGQHQLEQLDPNKNLYETIIQDSVNTEKTFIRNILGAFLFSGDSVDKSVKVLSGGEKARLVLASILASPGNVLLLDEPTNHLDIKSVEMLAEAMKKFSGTILFVSHDEFFISTIATRILEIRPGMIRDFPGTLSDYRSYLEMLFPEDNIEQTNSRKDVSVCKNEMENKEQRIKDREQRKKLSRAIDKLEREISSKEECLDALRTTLNDPSNALNHEFLFKTSQQIDSAQADLNRLIKEWEEKQLDLESIAD